MTVICLYSKLGGLNCKHSAVTDAPSITALSYVGLQVFGHSYVRWFTHIPEETAQLQTKRFALPSPKNLLLLLRLTVQLNQTQLVEVSSEDIKGFDIMVTQKRAIETALKKYKGT